MAQPTEPVLTWNLFAWIIILPCIIYIVRKWVEGILTSIDNLKTQAEERSKILHGKIDTLVACMTVVKVECEKKVERDKCDERYERVLGILNGKA